MFNSEKDRKTGKDKAFGMYRAVVVDVNDPINAGRVKVNVFSIHDDVNFSNLPWAIYSDPFMGGSADKGGFFVPDEKDTVWVFFEEGDVTQPVYFAGAPAFPHLPKESKQPPYSKNKMWKTKSGHFMEFNDGDGYIRFTHSNGSFIMMNKDGDIITESKRDTIHNVGRDYKRRVTGKTVIEGDGDYSNKVGGDSENKIEGNSKNTVGGDYDLSVSGKAKESMSTLTINTTSYTLNAGGSSFGVSSSGSTINAQNFNISSAVLTHNGVNIGDSHKHGGVKRGDSDTDNPS